MAALSANAVTPPRHNPGSDSFVGTYKATGADEYYNGAVVCYVSPRAILTNADGVVTLGFHMGRTTITAADEPVKVHVAGIWWVAAAGMIDGDLGTLMAPTAASDNPADIVDQAAGTPFSLGVLIHVDVTTTSGWIHLSSDRGLSDA